MCVLLVKSIAWKPTRSITGAISAIIAVVSAFALQRLWCPSRTVVSTSPIMPGGCGRARRRTGPASPFCDADLGDRRRAAPARRCSSASSPRGCRPACRSSTGLADLDERRLAGRRRAVERSDHRRGDVDEARRRSARPPSAGAARRCRRGSPRRKRIVKRGVSSSNSSKLRLVDEPQDLLHVVRRQIRRVAHSFGFAAPPVIVAAIAASGLAGRRAGRAACWLQTVSGRALQQEELVELVGRSPTRCPAARP